MKVPGKKKVVSIAMIFMAELSCLLATAISLESFARMTLIRLSDWAMRLNSFLKLDLFKALFRLRNRTFWYAYYRLLRLHSFL
jgi:hypothetical protein